MELKTKVIIVGILTVGSFAAGRYTAEVSKTETKEIVTNEKDSKQTDIAAHTHTITVITKQPDGVEKTVITTQIDTHEQDKIVNTIATKEEDKTVTTSQPTLSLSALVGVNPIKVDYSPIYGLMVTKRIIGPVNAGLFGFTNGIIGVSIGMSF